MRWGETECGVFLKKQQHIFLVCVCSFRVEEKEIIPFSLLLFLYTNDSRARCLRWVREKTSNIVMLLGDSLVVVAVAAGPAGIRLIWQFDEKVIAMERSAMLAMKRTLQRRLRRLPRHGSSCVREDCRRARTFCHKLCNDEAYHLNNGKKRENGRRDKVWNKMQWI